MDDVKVEISILFNEGPKNIKNHVFFFIKSSLKKLEFVNVIDDFFKSLDLVITGVILFKNL